MNWTATGAISLALAVMIGAFGAHGLKGRLDEYSMTIYERAVMYHFFHALGILLAAALARTGAVTASAAAWAGWLLLAGIVLFSCSLYVLAITGVRTFGAVTPFGGLAFIAGWLALAIGALRVNK